MKKKLSPVMTLASERANFRARDAAELGTSRVALTRLVRQGELSRVARGVYAKADRENTQFDSLLEVAAQSQQGVLCLITALRFHNLTTQSPFEVWLALPNKARPPKIEYPPVRIVWYSGLALTEGIEKHLIAGQYIKVYSVAKTIADCFKYRNKIGIDVALEALHDAWKQKRVTMRDLYHFGKICRVQNVMRPYLESLL